MGCCRVDTPEREAGLREYLSEFALTTLYTTGDRQHQKIHQLAVMRRIAVGQYGLDDQQAAFRRHRLAALAQDRDRIVIAPIVQYMRQHKGIMPGWKVLEEIAGMKCTARF